jgi:hypothetical protein
MRNMVLLFVVVALAVPLAALATARPPTPSSVANQTVAS